VTARTLLAIALLAIAYESWLQHAGFVRTAQELLSGDPRIQTEYGIVHVSLLAGWSLGGEATLWMYSRGTEAHGVAYLQLTNQAGIWKAHTIEVQNRSQDHLLNLSPLPPQVGADQLHGARRLYLVAIGNSAGGEVDDLANFLRTNFNVSSEVLPPMPMPETGYDAKRKQWIAEMLLEAMASHFPDRVADPDARIMGVIDDDIYIREAGWPQAYNYRYANKYAVLQSARLDPAFYSYKPSQNIRRERLRKIALKCLGLLYFDFGESSNPRSPMSFEGTVRDVDEQAGAYLASDLAAQARSHNFEGKPCLTFSAANVGGLPRLDPIAPCLDPSDISQKSFYQVDLSTGEFRAQRIDLYSTGPLPLFIQRILFSRNYDGKVRAFGKSSWHNLDDTVWSTDPHTIQMISIHGAVFHRITPGTGFSPDAQYMASTSANAGDFSNALLTWEGRWKIEGNGLTWHYLGCSSNSAIPCYFVDQTNMAGDRISVERDSQGRISKALQSTGQGLPVSSAGIWSSIRGSEDTQSSAPPDSYDHIWTFTYDGPMIQRIEDNHGSWVSYIYNANGYLTDVKSDEHPVHIEYDERDRMNRVVEDGAAFGIHYDEEGRVDEIDLPGRSLCRIRYGGENIQVSYGDRVYEVKTRDDYFQVNVTSQVASQVASQ
jgi:predicted Zn-dependent protease